MFVIPEFETRFGKKVNVFEFLLSRKLYFKRNAPCMNNFFQIDFDCRAHVDAKFIEYFDRLFFSFFVDSNLNGGHEENINY